MVVWLWVNGCWIGRHCEQVSAHYPEDAKPNVGSVDVEMCDRSIVVDEPKPINDTSPRPTATLKPETDTESKGMLVPGEQCLATSCPSGTTTAHDVITAATTSGELEGRTQTTQHRKWELEPMALAAGRACQQCQQCQRPHRRDSPAVPHSDVFSFLSFQDQGRHCHCQHLLETRRSHSSSQ